MPTVELCAYYAAEGRPVPAGTVPVNPYDRAVEAIHAAAAAIFAAPDELAGIAAASTPEIIWTVDLAYSRAEQNAQASGRSRI